MALADKALYSTTHGKIGMLAAGVAEPTFNQNKKGYLVNAELDLSCEEGKKLSSHARSKDMRILLLLVLYY